MWIALTIFAFLATVIAVILLLPVKVIVKNDENNTLILRYKLLFKTYGENPNPNDPIVKTLKKAGGVERLEKNLDKEKLRSGDLKKVISESYSTLIDLLKELVFLLKNCTATKLHIEICSAGEDPAQAAVNYGIYSAATYSLLGALQSVLKIRKRGCNINIHCNFQESATRFRYHLVLAVPFYRVLAAFWRAVLAEAKRANQPK